LNFPARKQFVLARIWFVIKYAPSAGLQTSLSKQPFVSCYKILERCFAPLIIHKNCANA
jgi:hypothetical protein